MRHYLVIFFILVGTTAFADEIFLNDGRVIKGKIIRVTDKNIEYDPDGPVPFDVFPRGQIVKIVYDDGTSVFLNENAGKREEGAHAPDAQPAKGAKEHDGFYMRFQLGFGYGKSTINDFKGDDLSFKGASTTFNMQLGYAFIDNVIVFIENSASVLGSARASYGGALPSGDTKTDVSISNLGIGISYYFMPVNIYISPVISLTTTKFDGSILKGSSNNGAGFSLSVGKEWWVSDNWGIGVALFGYLGLDTVTEKSLDRKHDLSNAVFGVLFSATYN